MSGDTFRERMTEAQMLQTLKDYAQAQGGFFWHVRDARGQDLQFMPDTLILIPRAYDQPGVVGLFEIKTQRDRVSVMQQQAIFIAQSITEVAAGIIRPTPKHPTEITLDEALARLGKEET